MDQNSPAITALIDSHRRISLTELLRTTLKACESGHSSDGLPFAVFGAATDSAPDTVFIGPFGSSVTPDRSVGLIRAYLMHSLLESITPTPGRLVVFGSPVGTPAFANLDRAARSRLIAGDFSDVDRLHFNCLQQLKVTTMRLSGYSQGAAFAVSLERHARSAGVSVTSLSLGDPPGLVSLRPLQLLRRFARELEGTKDEVAATPIGAYREAYHSQFGGQARARHAAVNIRANTGLLAGHACGILGGQIVAAAASGTAVSITVGQNSKVSSAEAAAVIAEQTELVRFELLEDRGHGWIHHLPTFLEFFLRHTDG